MLDDGDRLLDLIGVGLVLFIVIALAVIVLAAMNAPYSGDTPETDWRIQRVNETHVQVSHAGGDAIESSNLVVEVGGVTHHPDWPAQISTGDSGIVRAEPGQTIQLYWTGGRGDRALLQRWQLPETTDRTTSGRN
jgi:hypothetical protein